MTGRSKWRSKSATCRRARALPCAGRRGVCFRCVAWLAAQGGRRRALQLLQDAGHEDWSKRPIRTLSKGMAQTVQLLGTIIHEPRLIVLDEPFAGLDAINQQKLEQLIRDRPPLVSPSSFRPMSSPMLSGCARRIAIIAEERAVFEGDVNEARGRLRPIVHLRYPVGGRAVAHRPSIRPRSSAANGSSSFPPAARSRCSGAHRGRRGYRDIEHRAARPARCVHRNRRGGSSARDGSCASAGRLHEASRNDPRGLRHRPS